MKLPPIALALVLAGSLSAGSCRAADLGHSIPAYSASYTGSIGGKKIAVSIDRFAGHITGAYFYSGNSKHPLALRGSVSGDAFDATETVGGKSTGSWHGTLTPGTITGTWTSPDGKKTWPLRAASGAAGKAFPYDIRIVMDDKVDLGKIIKTQVAGACDSNEKELQVAAIELVDPATGRLAQTLGGDGADGLSQGTCTLFVPIVEDMNFDGWPDLRIAQFLPAAPNVPYAAWLFDPKTRQLIMNDDLTQITAPDFDPVKKRVTSDVRNSCCSYTSEVYAWKKGRLRLIEKTDIDYLDPSAQAAGKNCYVEKHYRLVSGRMALTKTDKGCNKG